MADKNPFDDEPLTPSGPPNPFGEPAGSESQEDAIRRIEQAARKIRGLRSQLGAEGLTPAAMREMIDAIASGLEAVARGLRPPAED